MIRTVMISAAALFGQKHARRLETERVIPGAPDLRFAARDGN
jgi:hypothetical protein